MIPVMATKSRETGFHKEQELTMYNVQHRRVQNQRLETMIPRA